MAGIRSEEWKDWFKDESLHVFIGQIKRLHIADDKSFINVTVEVWPEIREIICTMTWDHVGPGAGIYALPVAGDLVLCCSAEGDVDQSFVLKRLSSKEDFIPDNALTGDTVIKALSGKATWITSDEQINLSKGDEAPTENLVLGQVFKTFASEFIDNVMDILDALKLDLHTGNLGFTTGPTVNPTAFTLTKVALTQLKASTIESDDILSDLVFTEKK